MTSDSVVCRPKLVCLISEIFTPQIKSNNIYVHTVWLKSQVYIRKGKEKEESLFYLMMPLECIDFHIVAIGYQAYGHCDISLEETRCHHIATLSDKQQGIFICTLPQTGEHFPQPLMDQLCTTGWNGK